MHEDTYFLDPETALVIAKQQNKCGFDGDIQICYYHGEKIQSDLSNLIHLTIENILDELSSGKLKMPKVLDFTGVDLPVDIKKQISANIEKILEKADKIRVLDTYFLSSDEALVIANMQNRYGQNNANLQLCYYDGDEIKSDLVNLIHLPQENFLDKLAHGSFRIPVKVNFNQANIDEDDKVKQENDLINTFKKAEELRGINNLKDLSSLRSAKLDFSEPLRFYLMASISTRVMQFVSKAIVSTLEQKGYKTYYNLYYGIEDTRSFRNIAKYNPHVTININHLNNTFLSDDVFNFIWFQDNMPILTNNEKIYLRDRDYIFSYATIFTDLLLKKSVPKEKIFQMDIVPVDINEFYIDDKVRKEKKIVFVGSRYQKSRYSQYINKDMDQELISLLENGELLTSKKINKIFKKNNINLDDEETYYNEIQQGYIRNICVEWLCNNHHKVEVYGYDWEKSKKEYIIEKFKGKVKKSDLNKVYNSAKYVLSASGQVINTQRLGEIVHAGSIPVIYDSRGITNEAETWDDECLYFKTKKELDYILDNNIEPKSYRSEKMLKHFTYDGFMNTIFEQIKQKVNK